ncbi:MAG: 4-(cytidine 5'-diphospho)-2-C-methyl-D-erythritol kinase [Desulfobacteraceae bacterium]
MHAFTRLCPAKVNLFLKVVNRRSDGYHNLVTVMQPLTLADQVTLALTGEEIVLDCDHPEVPNNERNLAYRAAQAFQAEVGQKFGVLIHLRKNIPVAAGLGGGSSDAAGVLMGLNALTGGPLTFRALHRLAGGLGADVPFFLLSGPALGRGIGTQLTPLRLPASWYVLVNPGFQVPTGWVYANLTLPPGRRSDEAICARLARQNWASWFCNDLESVTMKAFPQLAMVKAALREQGAIAALMSGSGPTIFGIFSDFLAARNAAQHLETQVEGWIQVTQGISGDHLLTSPKETF